MKKMGSGIFVDSSNYSSFESMLRSFGRKVKDRKLILEIKERRFYEKKSDKNRRKRSAARARCRRENQNREKN